MDLHYKQEVTVGMLVIAALVALLVGMTWLSGKSLGPGTEIRFGVRFANVMGLRTGDPVQISGVTVGRVAGIQLESVGQVMVQVEVRRDVRPRVDARAQVRGMDAFGAMFVDYEPGIAEELLRDGQIIVGTREAAMMEAATGLAGRAGDVLTSAENLLSPRMADELYATMRAARAALETISVQGREPVAREAADALAGARRAMARLDTLLANPGLARSLNQLDEVTQNLNEMAEGLAGLAQATSSVMRRVDAGEGTMGRMVSDTTLYVELTELSRSMRLLLDDMRERPNRYFNLRVF